MRSFASSRALLLLSSWIVALTAVGQCQVLQIGHEFPGVCLGHVWLDCSGVDSVVWSNGSQAFVLTAPAGSYSFSAYSNGVFVGSGGASIESHGWELDGGGFGGATGNSQFLISGWPWIPYCNTSIFNSPCCSPQQPVEVFLVQDGVTVMQPACMGCHNAQCSGGTTLFHDVPCGHEYTFRIVDPDCAGTYDILSSPIIAPNNANLYLDTLVVGSIPGLNTGSITLLEAIPDTTEPFPIHSPVTGTIYLFEGLVGSNPVGPYFTEALSGIWNALDTGYYRLQFTPNLGCQTIVDTIYVPAVLNVGEKEPPITSALSIAPSITDMTLTLRSKGSAERVWIIIRDAYGRVVLEASDTPGPFSVERLVPGPYFLTAVQGREELRARFIKR